LNAPDSTVVSGVVIGRLVPGLNVYRILFAADHTVLGGADASGVVRLTASAVSGTEPPVPCFGLAASIAVPAVVPNRAVIMQFHAPPQSLQVMQRTTSRAVSA
jgi:hypothetical protein